jgi:hypothetical protein
LPGFPLSGMRWSENQVYFRFVLERYSNRCAALRPGTEIQSENVTDNSGQFHSPSVLSP